MALAGLWNKNVRENEKCHKNNNKNISMEKTPLEKIYSLEKKFRFLSLTGHH